MENQIQPKKLPKLTKKQEVFVDEYLKTGIASQAVKKAYDPTTDLTARSIGAENLTKPNIIEAIEVKRKSLKQALIDRGINEDYISEKVEVLLTAVDENGNTDYSAVDKGLKHASNFYGVASDDDKPKVNNTYNFIFSPEVQEQVKVANETIKSKLINHDSK